MKKSNVTIATLMLGQVLLASARKVKGGKLELEFAEKIQNPNQSVNVLAALNADDERFKGNQGARRAYLTASPAMALEYFGIKAEEIKDDAPLECNILNPELGGKALRIQVKDSFEGTEYQMNNQAKTAKQYTNSKTGETKYFLKEGKLIFSNTTIVNVEPKHDIWTSEKQVTWEQYEKEAAVPVATGEAINAHD